MTHLAHTRPLGESGPSQDLDEHLQRVAKLAASFAPAALSDLARTAGRWHDLGKYQHAFQRYIGAHPESARESGDSASSAPGVPHSAAGAALALERLGISQPAGLFLALAIEAHHGALKSQGNIEQAVQRRGSELLQAARIGGLPDELQQEFPAFTGQASALAVRMLFSALVDADLLDTEAWALGRERTRHTESLLTLRDRLESVCNAKIEASGRAAGSKDEQTLSDMRRQVYHACVSAGAVARGAFTLTVPTGGGKTLSGLSFALHHAVLHGMHRVIVVAPYTSILEQTAQVYRDALGADNVVEHHSNLSPFEDTDLNRQACENWDAPVIVTTSVQFFESLYAAHKRPCRKLHRIANSVVLLDEVQTFPAALLQPIHAVLQRLVADFGVTIVHGTATQPLLSTSSGVKTEILPPQLRMPMHEIIPFPAVHFQAVQHRFELEVPWSLDEPLDPRILAAAAASQPSALVITHSRNDARQLADLLGDLLDSGCLHLSAAMCAVHRSDVLASIRARLTRGERCHIVSTQLIEAGVDLDFPVVYRAMAGLDTLAQAAGRCNRGMRLSRPGRFVVYQAGALGADGVIRPSDPPRGTPTLGMQVARTSFRKGQRPDLSDPHLYPAYNAKVLNRCDTDSNNILGLEDTLDFPEVAARFRMVDEATVSVIAPYGDASILVKDLRAHGPSRERFRALQRFTVGLRSTAFQTLYAAGWLTPVLDSAHERQPLETLWCVRDGDSSVYDMRFGFSATNKGVPLRPLIE